MSTKFDPKISIIRVCAMLSIIIGHWLSMQKINHFQFGAIGVEIFLFISGYLYSDKCIDNIKKWIINRCNILLFPYWVVLVGNILCRLCFGYEVTLTAIIVFFLNLQGIDRVFRKIPCPILTGMGQTWFLSVLMICYIIMLLFKKKPIIEKQIRTHIKFYFVGTVLLQISLSLFSIQIIRPLCFFYGYFFDRNKLNMSAKKYSILTMLLILLTVIRFITHISFDGSILYDYIVFGWSFVILAIWLIVTSIKIMTFVPGIIAKITNSKFWRILDLMTYPLFLTHYMFTSGELAINKWIDNLIGQILVFVVLICITAFVVLFVTDNKTLKKIIADN